MNVFCFGGRLTRDPDVRTTQSGKTVANFSIAINEGKDKVTFLNCAAWETLADVISKYCRKGDQVSGTGKIEIRKYEKDGENRTSTEILVREIVLPPKPKGYHQDAADYQSQNYQSHSHYNDMNDDIPF